VTCDVRLDDVDPASGALLGWVVREGATNVLRHARPRHCTLRIGAEAGARRPRADERRRGRAEPGRRRHRAARARRAAGPRGRRLWSGRDPDGTFRLHAELPALVPA
jgi:two-component system sensor histidine kinase DesK